MIKKFIVVLVITLLSLFNYLSADARLMESWDYDRLAEKSNLIVIGVQSLPSKISSKKMILPNIMPETSGYETITTFVIVATLKGQATEKVIRLRHCTLNPQPVTSLNGPGLVNFDPNYKYAYLLFLKEGGDGIYEPMSGQTDPDQSIKKIDGLTYSDYYVNKFLPSQKP